MYSKAYLLEKIEYLREEMSKIALEKGFTDDEAVRISQELDYVLNAYNEIEIKGCSMTQLKQQMMRRHVSK